MNTMVRMAFVGSLVTNVVLGALLVAQHRGSRGGADAASEATDSQSLRSVQALHHLQAIELPAAALSAVLAAYVCEEPSGAEYWKPIFLREAQSERRTYELLEAARASLSKLHPSKLQNAAVAAVFAPYARQYPFLTPDKQRALQKIRAEHQGRLLDEAASGPQGAAAVSRSVARMNDEIRALLSPEEYFEYALRASPISQQLIATGFDFSEEEFRKVFAAFWTDPDSASAARTLKVAAQRAALKEALGERRYFEFERSRDPAYRLLWSHAGRHGLTPSSIDEAHLAIHRSIEQLVAAGVGQSAAGASARVRAIHEERDKALRAALGDAAQREISRQLTMFAPTPASRVIVQAR